MRFVKFFYAPEGSSHRRRIHSDYGYDLLGAFFDCQVWRSGTFYKNCVLYPERFSPPGNYLTFRRKGSNIIIYDVLFDPSDEEMLDKMLEHDIFEAEEEFTLSDQDFLHLLDEWMKYEGKGYVEFWIKNEHGVYWCERVK